MLPEGERTPDLASELPSTHCPPELLDPPGVALHAPKAGPNAPVSPVARSQVAINMCQDGMALPIFGRVQVRRSSLDLHQVDLHQVHFSSGKLT